MHGYYTIGNVTKVGGNTTVVELRSETATSRDREQLGMLQAARASVTLTPAAERAREEVEAGRLYRAAVETHDELLIQQIVKRVLDEMNKGGERYRRVLDDVLGRKIEPQPSRPCEHKWSMIWEYHRGGVAGPSVAPEYYYQTCNKCNEARRV